eukprot:TRINITY_DN858_c3_g1_i1.p1 TRINITY_DN858_c3_g1~~TRINITY_DN858_c3_g1_i1.p1  ORF type:complete len:453 (-),score=181.76 TRINITY_DN858_c3_g1_i1:550-1908(-)
MSLVVETSLPALIPNSKSPSSDTTIYNVAFNRSESVNSAVSVVPGLESVSSVPGLESVCSESFESVDDSITGYSSYNNECEINVTEQLLSDDVNERYRAMQYATGGIQLSSIGFAQPPCRIHPREAKLNAELRQWTYDIVAPWRLGLENQIDEYNTMCTYLFPDASDERLLVMGKLANVQFVHDDLIDGRLMNDSSDYMGAVQTLLADHNVLKAGVKDILYVLNTGKKPESVSYSPDVAELLMLDYYAEAAEGFLRLSNADWMKRFMQHMVLFYKNQIDSVTKKMRFNSCAEFVEYRTVNSGLMHMVDLVEFSLDTYMPQEVLDNEVIRSMQRNLMLIGCLSNDIFSFEKETLRDGKEQHNLVHVAMTTEGLSLRQAVEKTAGILTDNLNNFYEKMEVVKTWNRPDILRYCVGLEAETLGGWPWQLSTCRYLSELSPFAELLPKHKRARFLA